MKTVHIELLNRNKTIENIAGVLVRQIEARCGAKAGESKGEASIRLAVRQGIGEEGFEIADGPNGSVQITGNDERGLLYGVGKFLRSSRFDEEGFTPGGWRGRSVPEKPFRAIYFATHFHNFYHDAPVEAIERYVEELGLWGYNAVIVWYDMHHFNGFDDPDARKMIARLRSILKAAKRVGLRAGLTMLANEGYADSPEALRHVMTPSLALRATYGKELCPSKPGARELMLTWFEQTFRAFSEVGLDYLCIWPYDQGGCGCEQCRPWGANGFLKIAEPVALLARKAYPSIKIILSTWLFDIRENEGEWEGLARDFERRPGWVDYILADSHATFPEYPLAHDAPGGLPLVNFPEISMWGMYPWGGYGANPLPERFQGLWDSIGRKLSGGFPYSEGIFEDINKAVISGFYWKSDRKAEETLKEYIAYEYSPDAVKDILCAVRALEKNHTRPEKDGGSAEAFAALSRAESHVAPSARRAWRWRILYLRALLDREHYAIPGRRTEEARRAISELVEIYHAQNAEASVKPPL
ncbi:MAG: hypothetical protein IT210_26490 [Armatimonadetes bacterium]|nr:hypothetical protein [Armatimonadota bacterium]